MFPISSDGVFEDPSIFFEQDNFIEELLADCPILEAAGNENTEKIAKKRQKKASSSSEVQEINYGGGQSDGKKTAHRFTERQRRQEMSALYASLRSLLPLEYVKGKRAISDHMHQAVNYINDMKKKMEGMQKRRDELRKLSTNNVASTCADSNTNVGDSTNFVKITPLRDGMEILISSTINKERFNLSKVFEYLVVEKNLNIINCVSTTGASSYLHKIHIQINDAPSIDLPALQEQLQNLIRFA